MLCYDAKIVAENDAEFDAKNDAKFTLFVRFQRHDSAAQSMSFQKAFFLLESDAFLKTWLNIDAYKFIKSIIYLLKIIQSISGT